MEAKKNEVLQKYVKSLSEELVKDYFSGHSSIAGSDILHFCEIKQVNFFIVEQLMRDWQAEMLRLKSPYFDYTSPEVHQALKTLMNKLSHHISIEQDDFYPLVEKAFYKTIELCEAPFEYLRDHYLTYDDLKVEVQQITKDLKYVKLNKEIIEQALKGFDSDDEINTEDLIERVEKQYIAQKEELFDLKDLLTSCAEIVPLPDGLTEHTSEEVDDNDVSTPSELSSVDSAQEPETTPESQEEESLEKKDEEPEPSASKNNTEPEEKTIQDNIKEQPASVERMTLNDKLKRESKQTLADTLKKPGITSLKQSLGINQRYTFMKELFGNDADVFNDAIEKVDEIEDYESAINYLIDHYAREYNWDDKEEVTGELFHMLSRKF